MRVAISGVRDLSPHDLPIIEGVIADIISEGPEEILFGGARGTDTVALAAACTILAGVRPPRLIVIVPRRLKDQPDEAQEWAKECADDIVELKAQRLDVEAYRRRNETLVLRSDGLVAFWDGRSGGTGMTIDLARRAGRPVEVVAVMGESAGLGARGDKYPPIATYSHPWPHWVYGATTAVGMPVVTLGLYMPAVQGLDRLTQFVRATKAGTVSPAETKYWADVASAVINARPELSDAAAIIPVPRRAPGRANDMADFVRRIAKETGKIDGTGLLVRTEEPIGGEFKGGRDRFLSDEHARTIAVDPEHPVYGRLSPGSKAIVLDNVLTFGGTLEGARQAFRRYLPEVTQVGVAVLVSGDYAIT